MKRKVLMSLLILLSFIFVSATAAIAKDYSGVDEVLVPTQDGNDLIVPQFLLETLEYKKGDKPVAIFHDRPAHRKAVNMVQEGYNWRIPGGIDEDVHPVLNGEFALLEDAWPNMPKRFIKYRGPQNTYTRPCIRVNKDGSPARQ